MNKELPRSPDLAELLRIAIKDCISQVHVSLPGRIEVYDVATQRADIKPMLKRPLVARDGTVLEAESLPVLADVPVVFPRGGSGAGSFFITWPLEKGDLVHVVFNERSIDQYMAGDGVETDPLDFRTHNLSDGVAYPGFYPESKALADADDTNMVLGLDGGVQIHIKPNGEIHLGSKDASDALALASQVQAELQAIVDAIKNGVPVAMDGGAALQTSIVALLNDPVPSVGSAVVKSE